MPLRNYPTNIPEIDTRKVRARMNFLRTMQDKTIMDIAKATGLSKTSVNNVELNCPQGIALSIIASIAKALNCDPMWLIGLSDNNPPTSAVDAVELEINGIPMLVDRSTAKVLLGKNYPKK